MMLKQRGSRIDTLELKADIIKRIGHQRAERYFGQLGRLLTFKVSKKDFSKYCGKIFGKENLHLHNQLIVAILKNANVTQSPPLKGRSIASVVNDRSGNSIQRNVLGPVNGTDRYLSNSVEVLKAKEHQSATELFSLGSRPPVEVVSVEDGEEVEQRAASPSIQSKSPVTAPLGISVKVCEGRKIRLVGTEENNLHETCQVSGQLPDTLSLKKRLARRLEIEGIESSTDCVNLLNSSLDVYIKRLVEPCLEIAASRVAKRHVKEREHLSLYGSIATVHGGNLQPSTGSVYASVTDLYTSLEINPLVLGGEWALQLEKICPHV